MEPAAYLRAPGVQRETEGPGDVPGVRETAGRDKRGAAEGG